MNERSTAKQENPKEVGDRALSVRSRIGIVSERGAVALTRQQHHTLEIIQEWYNVIINVVRRSATC
jgi:hypothetical protein